MTVPSDPRSRDSRRLGHERLVEEPGDEDGDVRASEGVEDHLYDSPALLCLSGVDPFCRTHKATAIDGVYRYRFTELMTASTVESVKNSSRSLGVDDDGDETLESQSSAAKYQSQGIGFIGNTVNCLRNLPGSVHSDMFTTREFFQLHHSTENSLETSQRM